MPPGKTMCRAASNLGKTSLGGHLKCVFDPLFLGTLACKNIWTRRMKQKTVEAPRKHHERCCLPPWITSTLWPLFPWVLFTPVLRHTT